MKNIWWQTIGVGNVHLILLHGWGLSSEVWHCVQKALASKFTLHLVDLPGFGRSRSYKVLSLDEMAKCVLKYAPKRAIWLGWSLGGLVASQVALICPEQVQALVTVASSPCFSTRGGWPGIELEILTDFQERLRKDFQRTIDHFFVLQTIGAETARHDARILKQMIFSVPTPSIEVLNNGLEILKIVDLRKGLSGLRSLPHLRIYGYLDSLIPHKIVSLLDRLWPNSESILMPKAAHVPFISHSDEFCAILIRFILRLG